MIPLEETLHKLSQQVYRGLAELRHQRAILFGGIDYLTNGTVFAYNRVKKGNPGYLVAANLGDAERVVDVSGLEK